LLLLLGFCCLAGGVLLYLMVFRGECLNINLLLLTF
jgi:hypothetical protein